MNKIFKFMAALILLPFAFFNPADAQEPPKACIDLRTMEIIYVPAGMPCPYPTTEY